MKIPVEADADASSLRRTENDARVGAGAGTVSLESVIATAELGRRKCRPADYEAENLALTSLLHEMTRSSADILQKLVETALTLCRGHSAGISILQEQDGREVFAWRALAGRWRPLLGGTMPRDFSPCGTALDRDTPLLMAYPERYFLFPADAPPIVEMLLLPFHVAGKAVGTVWTIAHDGSRRFDAEDLRLLTNLSKFAATAYQMSDAQEREARVSAEMAGELAATRRLQDISTRLIPEGDADALYRQILDAATDLMHSDTASLQMLHADRNELRLIASKGFAASSAAFWETVHVDSGSTCGEALRTGARVTIPDLEACEFVVGTPHAEAFRASGIRAAQSTPLVSRAGQALGMMSTHWRKPHRPSERDLRLFDVLARQAADLIERARAEARLRESEARANRVLKSITDSLQVLDADWRLTYMNASSRRVFIAQGLEPDDQIGRHFWDEIFPQARGTLVEREYRRAMTERVPVELEYFHEPWRRWYAIRAFPIEEGGIAIYFQDISERKQAEIVVRRSEANLRNFLETAPIGIHWVDADGIITWANRTELEMLGYSRDEYVGHRIAEFHVDQDAIADILNRLRKGETLNNYHARLRHKDGSIRYGAINSDVLREDGEFIHSRCFTRDITEKKHLAERARAQFAELENIYRTAPVGLALIDEQFRFARINERMAEINGLPADQQVGRGVREIVPALADQAVRVFRQVFQTGKPVLDVEFTGETRAQPGVRRTWNESWYPLKDAAGATVAINVVVEEITERKRAEAALAESVRIKDALYQLADRLHRTKSLEDVYDAALQAIVSALQCDRASILLFDETGVMRFVGSHGLSDAYRAAVEGHSPWQPGENDPEPICIGHVDTAELSDALRATVKAEGIGALAFIPLVSHGRLIGKFMTYFNAPHIYTADEIELGTTIARQLAFGIERRRAQELLQHNARQLALITDTAPVFIAYFDAQARYKFVNQAYAKRFGLGPEECIGKPLSSIIGRRAYEVVRTHVAIVLRGEPTEFEMGVPYAGIGERYMHCSYAPEFDAGGNVVGFVAAVTDITERKRAEEALRRSEEGLKEADRRKDEFLATLAHELRNPLAPLINGLEVMKIKRDDAAAIERLRSMMERQLGHMVRLIDDLLDVSRISRGKIELRKEPIELAGVVQQALETNRPLIDANGQALAIEMPSDPIIVEADVARLAQVVGNLLNNACKFTPAGGRICLAVKREGEQAVVRVRDTGVGIAPEQFDRIFEMFTQVDTSLERTESGLGIGLTLARTFTQMHGGAVEVHSAGVGQGSEFVVRLPMQSLAGAARRAEPVAGEDARATARRILVVDDNADSADSLAALLELDGHATRVANDGVAALQAAASFRPDLILLDIGLPRLNGYEVACRIRAQPWGQSVALVALTGWGQENDRQKSREAGFDNHLVKPIDHAALIGLLAGLG